MGAALEGGCLAVVCSVPDWVPGALRLRVMVLAELSALLMMNVGS